MATSVVCDDENSSALAEGALRAFSAEQPAVGRRCDPRWLAALGEGLRHETYVIHAQRDGRLMGVLPLMFVKTALFGKFLVSLPYLNSAGVAARDANAATELVDRAVQLADELRVRFLELRHETEISHPALTHNVYNKVHMRLPLPTASDDLWKALDPKVRNQVRKAEKQEVLVESGGIERLDEFYEVFSVNMRHLGTPVYGRVLFASILSHFEGASELFIARLAGEPIAAALLVHVAAASEVPSASSLRAYNSTNANMLVYWRLLQRAIERGQPLFDFGRSSPDSNTYRFKRQWGAEPEPAVWQYYLRQGSVGDMRPESPKYQRAKRIWRSLPLRLTRWLGPIIVRGIP